MPEGTEALWTLKDLQGIEGRTLDSQRIVVLDELLRTTYGSKISIDSIERLRSKKNIVLHLVLEQNSSRIDVVAKLFIEKSFEIETEVLVLGAKESLPIPTMITANDGVLLMAFIDGSPLVDVLNKEFAPSLIERLAEWYYNFHHKTGHIKGDPRLRNFILSKEQIYGFDFEEYRRDHWMVDIGGISASILDTRPVFDTRKVKLSWHLLETYLALSNRERDRTLDTHFSEVIADALEQTAKWRSDDRILAHSKRVRQLGLPFE